MARHGFKTLGIATLGAALAVGGGYTAQAQPQGFLPPVLVMETAPDGFLLLVKDRHGHRHDRAPELRRGNARWDRDHDDEYDRVDDGNDGYDDDEHQDGDDYDIVDEHDNHDEYDHDIGDDYDTRNGDDHDFAERHEDHDDDDYDVSDGDDFHDGDEYDLADGYDDQDQYDDDIWGRVVKRDQDHRRSGRELRQGCIRTGWTWDGRPVFECVGHQPDQLQDRWTLEDNPFPPIRNRQPSTEPRNGHDNDASASRYLGHPSVISPNH